ncbi:hypothetical protein LOTGIDRAFT_203275 [Lottia gigantea]|uniref:Transgelin n=1 Tax=Lottia gigantea TaxID=225164 RepID=V3Z142_LOTGI|nr:hypothetical protein LOTGIDRAFT_203275 [Lottia gigantea]ESO84258.1 hypothetical protein LOTGIDRAFT_203275 [Lottia gigantea]
MASNRATKSGFAAEAADKISKKYDEGEAQQALEWLKGILSDNGMEGPTNTSGSQDNVYEQLKDGLYLSRLANVLHPGCVNSSKLQTAQKLAFKQMEMINIFLAKAVEFGVPATESFQTVDLFERTNLHQVILCLSSTARKAKAKGMRGYGPKESEANIRNFSEEQLKAGQNVIGLQMGSNKGATQAGQNFGKGRMIMD